MRPSSAPPPMRSIAPLIPAMGDLIAGKYRVISLIGEGGMGTVLAAHHELLDVRVAVKLVAPALLRHRNLVDRFLREAQAAARLKSEHVARVMDVGTLEGGEPYLVMDLLEGENLEQRIQRVGPMAIANAVDCILQALEGMAHAHAAGIVHRDLKPANLFATFTPDGREVVKVLDFGIAKLNDQGADGGIRSGSLTDDHAALGSPSYMAPEQVRASRVADHRADIWALGAILYELLTGRVAFGGQSVGEIFGRVLHEKAPRLRALRPDVPEELEAVIDGCLEREPRNRFPDVSQLAEALAPYGSGAWSSHVVRIHQTLERAGKASAERFVSERPPPPRASGIGGAPLSVPPPPTRSAAAASAQTLAADPAEDAERITSQLRRKPHVRIVAALGVVVVALAAVLVSASRSPASSVGAPAELRPRALTRADPPATPPMTESPRPPPAPSSSSSSSASSHSAAPAPARPGRAVKPPSPHLAASTSTKGETSPRNQLPGVLDSPE